MVCIYIIDFSTNCCNNIYICITNRYSSQSTHQWASNAFYKARLTYFLILQSWCYLLVNFAISTMYSARRLLTLGLFFNLIVQAVNDAINQPVVDNIAEGARLNEDINRVFADHTISAINKVTFLFHSIKLS